MNPEAYFGGTLHLSWTGTRGFAWDPMRRLVVCDTGNADATLRLPRASDAEIGTGVDLLRVHNSQAGAIITVQDADGGAVGSLASGVLGTYSLAGNAGAGEWIQTSALTTTTGASLAKASREFVSITISSSAERVVLRDVADQLGYSGDRPGYVVVDVRGGVTLQGATPLHSGEWPADTVFLIFVRAFAFVLDSLGSTPVQMDARLGTPPDASQTYQVFLEVAGTVSAENAGTVALRGAPASVITVGSGQFTGQVVSL